MVEGKWLLENRDWTKRLQTCRTEYNDWKLNVTEYWNSEYLKLSEQKLLGSTVYICDQTYFLSSVKNWSEMIYGW